MEDERRIGNRLWRFVMIIVLVWVTGVALPVQVGTPVLQAAPRVTPYLQNGSFESNLSNWTAMNQRIDLGVTNVGGCVSVDTTN